ncbi:hypothetical protein CXB51_007446 [Gossypium anomalum]|uniref:Aminotransferase-like plant mobile domain-containing protein n=1 Tax=Gossypium anomalum TaxID=47600 RepID=A0A8J6D4C0_9ROSI|nr:hypothetical protein CXB51_007446 [Gossypium anomalum]
MIRGYLMPDLSQNLVHLTWLLKLIDFRAVDEFSLGSAVLATLYREMCRATPSNKAKIGGCLSLLQSWARFHFSFLRPRWNHSASYVGIPTALEDIRLLLGQRSEAQLRSHWSTMLLSRCTRRIECCDNLDFDNRFLRNMRCSMMSTKSTTQIEYELAKLAYAPDYMPWFKIHGKPYLLLEEQRCRQIRVERERLGPLNPRRRDDGFNLTVLKCYQNGPAGLVVRWIVGVLKRSERLGFRFAVDK